MFKGSLKVAAILAGALLTCHSAKAAKVSLSEARQAATEFFRAGKSNPKLSEQTLKLAYTGGTEKNPLYYVFNSTDGRGFVMISAEDTTEPVLGYSFENSFTALPAPMQWMMAGIEAEIKAAPSIQTSLSVSERTLKARKAANRVQAQASKTLNTPPYSQESPFNSAIPGRPLVGCVGTAMGSIMKYYQWPAAGTGSFGGVDFGVNYDWANILNSNYRSGYTAEQGAAVAQLMYHTSKSIDTQYSLSGSSAYEQRVPMALTNYFGYDPGASYKRRSDVASQEEWDDMIRAEIDADRPVLYCGQDVTAGHAFICDGYDNSGMLHFNWGWGGSANGYYRTTALNPAVSRQHNYNNFNTIIYNIKPYRGQAKWSVLHVTADNGQAGLGSDMTNLNGRTPFSVRVGNIRNLSYDKFEGKIAVALFNADGEFKALLSAPQGFSMRPMCTLQEERGENSIWIRGCVLPEGVTADEADEVRLASSSDNGSTWNPMGGELYTSAFMKPLRTEPEAFPVNLPTGVAGVTIEGTPSVIREWDYTFRVVPQNPATDVVTVKANGVIIPAGANYTYTIGNVTAAQNVIVVVQKAADVVAKRSLYVKTPGSLSTLLNDVESAGVKDLTLFGQIDARDFTYIRTKLRLQRLDISSVYICAYDYDQACALPFQAFSECGTLEEVVLPKNLNRINNGAFRYSGIKSIVIPTGVSKYEYNVFVGCSRLRDIWVGRERAEFINWCVLSGCNKGAMTLHCPSQAAVNNYRAKDNWKEIANIIVDPIKEVNDVAFAVAENKDVDVECDITPGARYAKGSMANFTVKNMSTLDRRLDIYANDTKLLPDASGKYSVQLNANTLIHFDFAEPIETVKQGQFWNIASVDGSMGLLSEIVNVIRGQEFTVQVNNLNVPQGSPNQYWAMALCDKNGDIKEFISPIVMSTFSYGNANRFAVKCCVKECDIREGNQVRLVSSTAKKYWDLVPASSGAKAAVQALNNQNEMYSLTVEHNCEGGSPEAEVSGPGNSITKGFNYSVKIVAPSASHRIDVDVNGQAVSRHAQAYVYNFPANQDYTISVRVYPFIEVDEATIVLADGEHLLAKDKSNLNARLNELRNSSGNVKSKIIITGGVMDGTDFALIQHPDFRSKVKCIDLSGVKQITADRNNSANLVNNLPMYAFGAASDNTEAAFEEIILPNSINKFLLNAFRGCSKIRELTLPREIRSGWSTYSTSTTTISGMGLEANCLQGCTNLETLYVSTYPGNDCVNHIKVTQANRTNTLGLPDTKKVTVVVSPESYTHFITPKEVTNQIGSTTVLKGQNTWKVMGFNIVAEYPVYKLNYNPTHCFVNEKNFNADRAVSFLKDNISLPTVSLKDKFYVSAMAKGDNKPEGTAAYDAARTPDMVRVIDNGKLLPVEAVGADGSIDITYYNPNNDANRTEGRSGNHDVKVIYLNHVQFVSPSYLFNISLPDGVNNDGLTTFEEYDNGNELAPILKYVKEGDVVRFKVDIAAADGGESKLEARAKVGETILTPDAEGVFSLPVEGSNIEVRFFAIPASDVALTDEEFKAIDITEAAAATTKLALKGEISAETFATVKTRFSVLETADFSQVTNDIPAGMFEGNTVIASVALPEGATAIGANTFAGCSKLSAVAVSESVGSIGENAFKGCALLPSVTLTGVHTIGAHAFNGCDNLTSITLNAAAAGDVPSASAAPRRTQAFHGDAFTGVNPNCLVVLDEGVSVPQAAANYISTEMREYADADGAVNKCRVYSAAADIRFVAGKPIAIANPFSVTDAKSVSITAPAQTSKDDMGQWMPLIAPFDVQTVALAADGRQLTASTDESSDALSDRFTAISTRADRDASNEDYGMLSRYEKIVANQPYLVRIGAADQDVILSAANVNVAATPAEMVAKGETFDLKATYKAVAVDAANVYVLYEGKTFLPANDGIQTYAAEAEPVAIPAYSVYAVSPNGESSIPVAVGRGVNTGLTAVNPDAAMSVSVKDGVAVLYSATDRVVTLYAVDGRQVATMLLRAGANQLPRLPRGIYVVEGMKFAI